MSMKIGGTDEFNSEINVTPMVDVMLVLLIIFMVVTPMLQKGVSVDMARSEERRVGKERRYWRDWSSDVCSSDLSEINVTPMVDVMLVLLIIFMVVTPMLQKGVSVDMA